MLEQYVPFLVAEVRLQRRKLSIARRRKVEMKSGDVGHGESLRVQRLCF
jgi:hypothetical protein